MDCVNLVMEGTTVLVWTVTSTILVNSKASSLAAGGFDGDTGVVTAVATTTRLFEYLDEKVSDEEDSRESFSGCDIVGNWPLTVLPVA